ncbi:hypothetical protein [Rhizobium sp. 768_B6_N1_8]|uniref:hypothetical protein n=1 Tax=unclassified Rhizobium TaxID=2613769 RepID=UPI003F287506
MSTHDQRYDFCRVSYWTDHSAAKADEDWTECKVTPLGAYTYGEQTFANTDQDNYRMAALISFLEKVYELGRSAAKREIREVLGVKEPRP